MKSFLKYVLATIVGILAGFFLMGIIFVTTISIIVSVSSKPKTPQIKDNTVMTMTLSHPIPERTSNNPFEHFDFNKLKPIENPGLNDILASIKAAKDDDKIKGIYLEMSFIPSGWATVKSIRDELKSFKESGKFIIAFSTSMGQKAYYVASIADKIYINPNGIFQLNGLQIKTSYFINTLSKLGIDMQVIKGPDNKYKSAIEPFVRKNMSDENRYQLKELITDLWNNITLDISEGRNLPQENIKSFANNYSILPTESNIELGIIDAYKYKDEVITEIKQLSSTPENKDINTVSVGKYSKLAKKADNKKNKIAIVYATGEMVIDSDESDYMSANKISKALRDIRRDSSIDAVVLRINSVGGSALAGEIIWREMMLTKKVKPVIVSMGDIAASGGYYIACPANKIIAQENTITGSIGVYGIIPNAENLLTDKLGISFDEVKSGDRAGLFASDRPLSMEEKHMLNNFVTKTYNTFLNHVSEGRNISFEKANEIGRGRVWSAEDAITVGLIDAIGNMNLAISIAAEEAGITDYSVKSYPKQENPFEAMVKDIAEMKSKTINTYIPNEFKMLKEASKIISNDMIQTRLPFVLEIY
jgi:protease-4